MNAPTRYAVVQTTLDVPPVEKLARALTRVPGFLAADAPNIARDAFGVLAHRLDASAAATLQQALAAEGVAAELVPERELPPLPPGRIVRQIECRPGALQVYDPLNRSFPIEWKHVTLVAAGEVRVQEFVEVRREVRDPLGATGLFEAAGAEEALRGTRVERLTRERTAHRPALELVLGGAAQRLIIEVGPLLYRHLGEGRRADEWENFTRLVRRLLERAPHALPNRGAWCLRQEPPARFPYPSRNAFNEEIVWMLWKRGK